MARKVISGLDYLPLDLVFFQDRKIRKLMRRCGNNGPMVYLALLCMIYKDGYYLNVDEELSFDLSEQLHMKEQEVSDAIDACIETGLFNRAVFISDNVLTSAGIQRRYEYVCEKSKRKAHVAQYSLINSEEKHIYSEETTINSEEMGINSERNPISSEFNPTRKEGRKEGKEGRKKEKNFFIKKERVLAELFFKNMQDPECEYEKLAAYNSGPRAAKKWNALTAGEQVALAKLWEQVPRRPARFSEAFLDTWRKVLDELGNLGAPEALILDALSDKLRCDVKGDRLILTLSSALGEYIEEHVDAIRPHLGGYMKARGCKTLRYIFYDTEQPTK